MAGNCCVSSSGSVGKLNAAGVACPASDAGGVRSSRTALGPGEATRSEYVADSGKTADFGRIFGSGRILRLLEIDEIWQGGLPLDFRGSLDIGLVPLPGGFERCADPLHHGLGQRRPRVPRCGPRSTLARRTLG